MWSPFVFCLIVGLALGSNSPAWKDNREYIYKIHGRALAGLEIANEFSGILLKASLKLQTRPDGKLQGLIVNPQYAQIHSELSDGWMTYIPDHELSWKPLEMSRKPFQIEINHGVITDLIVNKGVPNWEANMIKGIVSQFQINLNEADSQTTRNDNRQDSASYNIHEETVSGNTDTMYEVNPIPEYMLLNSNIPDFQKLEEDDNRVMEVLKHKNYTDSIELPSYSYGFGQSGSEQPATNVIGKFFLRNTITRVLITGSLKKFTIQQSHTINQIVVHPTLGDKQKGAVYTLWNTTLEEVKPQEHILEDLASPVRLGGLVYTYAKPYSKSNEVKNKNSNRNQIKYFKPALQRLNPSVLSDNEVKYKQDQPEMNKAPETPFLPYTVGNKGRAIKLDVDAVSTAIKMAREIGKKSQDPRTSLYSHIMDDFVTLINILRTMDESELRQVSNELYKNNQDQSNYASWSAFRDAVAETGHGPAMLLIQSWIEVKKIEHEEASHIISTMTKSVQHPTTQYIKTFFEMMKKPIVAADWPLNETSILSFSNLVRQVFFDKIYFKNQYPVNAFENLKDKEGLRFVRDTVIPYFTQRLDKTILQADTNKIHTYIRALGNLGTPEILKAYEPYLEGKKHCSQFQRALMIVSMDKLVKTFPEQARSVLFRTYQNSAESSEVRVAAVFQLMRTVPTVEMLQYMASYTKIDSDEQVNAAVKSSIQTAAQLEGNEFKKLRDAAEMAQPLLTDQEYGIQLGGNFLKSYFVDQLNLQYKETAQLWKSDGQLIPNGIKYSLRSDIRGTRNQIINVQSLITSVEQLPLRSLTEEYKQEKQQKQQNSDESQYPWSSQNIAKILNIKSEVREQLEGSIFFMDLNSPYKMFSIDNSSLDYIPKIIRKLEDKFKNEQVLDAVKFLNEDHMVLAVPNEMGLPFVFMYNAPKYLRVQGKVWAASNPQLSQNGKIQMPEKMQAKLNVSVTVGSKISGHISFITPFDRQQYLSGFDKVLHAHVPVSSEIVVDFKKNELQIEVEPREIHNGAHLFHYSTWPFTAREDIMDLNAGFRNHQIIKPNGLRRTEGIYGKKEMGLAIQVEQEHERNAIYMSDFRGFCKDGLVNGFRSIWNDAQIQYSNINVTYLPKESSTEKIVLRLGYQQEYNKQGDEKPINWQEVREADNSLLRQQVLMTGAASGIKNVESYAVDASINFDGAKNFKYVLSGAYATSNVDARSRLYGFYKKEDENTKPFELKFQAINNVPNTNSMDLQDVLRSEPKAHSTVEIRFDSRNGEGKVEADIKLARSEERKQYFKNQPMYQQCVRDERVGNKQSPACVNMTIEANLLDRVDLDIKYENVNTNVENVIAAVYAHLEYMNYPNLEYKQGSSMPKKHLKLQARFDDDLRYVNVSVTSHEESVTFRDIQLNEFAKRILVVHPLIPVSTRAVSGALNMDTFRSACVVDKTQVTTFNNWTYPAEVSKYWTVVAQYVQKDRAVVEKQLKEQLWNYVILVRENQEYKEGKDLKIVLSSPETKFKVIDVTVTPTNQESGPKGEVKINDKQVQIGKTESHDIEHGYIQIYSAPNGEINVVIRNTFFIIYDGERARIETFSGFMRGSTRGLCGQFNYQQNEEFLTAQNCFARNPEKFVKSYEVEGSEGKQVRQELEKGSDECIGMDRPVFVNVIRDRDVNVFDQSEDQQDNDCTRYQTKYIEQGNEICFTTRVVPSCRSHCQAQGYITKSVSAHCTPNTMAGQIWKQQINNGASPDFSHKAENRKVQLELPQFCLLA